MIQRREHCSVRVGKLGQMSCLVLCLDPSRQAIMKFVVEEAERHEGIYVEKILHGKFVRIATTSLLLNAGTFALELKTGRPVMGSVMILGL